jgi:hypothetical protein
MPGGLFIYKAERISTLVMPQCSDKGLRFERRINVHVDDCYIGGGMKRKQAGMNAHLSKPVEPEHLYRTPEELIWERKLTSLESAVRKHG